MIWHVLGDSVFGDKKLVICFSVMAIRLFFVV